MDERLLAGEAAEKAARLPGTPGRLIRMLRDNGRFWCQDGARVNHRRLQRALKVSPATYWKTLERLRKFLRRVA